MIYVLFVAVFLLGVWLGYHRSHAVFGRMCDDGQLIWRYEDGDENGWEGEPEALASLAEWALSQ